MALATRQAPSFVMQTPLANVTNPRLVFATTRLGWVLVALIMLLALAVRLASWQAAYGHAIRADEPDYVIPAETLTRTGHYFDTFQTDNRAWTRVPLTGLVLAAAFATQPPVPPEATVYDTGLMTPRFAAGNLALILVSLGLLPLVMLLAAWAFPARRWPAALLAGLLTALYPPLINSAAQQLLSETLFITLMFAALATLSRWQPRRGAWPWLVSTGLLLGLAALTRSMTVAFLPFVAIWIWQVVRAQGAGSGEQRAGSGRWRLGVGVREALGGTALVTTLLLAAISPWTVYNYLSYGRLLLLDTANVNAFWQYNNFSGEDANAAIAALPNPADRQALIIGKGFANITAYPDRFAGNVLASLGYMWHLELQSAVQPNLWDLTQRSPDVPAVLPTDLAFLAVSFAGLAGLAALGRRAPADEAGRVRRLLVWWLVCMVLLGLIVPYDARYRMPMAPALIIFAAGLLVRADWRRVGDPRRWGGILRAQPGVAAGAALLCAWVIVAAATPSIPPAIQALALVAQGQPAAAVAAQPNSFWPYRVLAEQDRRQGQDDAARRAYGDAIRHGEDPRSILGLADLFYRHPDWTPTAEERRWFAGDPNNLRGLPWNEFRAGPLTRLAVGPLGDIAYLQGFQAAERADTAFRWSKGQADLRLPAPPGAPPAAALRLRLSVPAIGPSDPWPVTVTVAGAAPVTLAVGPGWTDYTVPLRPAVAGDLRVHLTSPARSPATFDPASSDTRLLGVGVQRLARDPAP
jgi:hypothetical protein